MLQGYQKKMNNWKVEVRRDQESQSGSNNVIRVDDSKGTYLMLVILNVLI